MPNKPLSHSPPGARQEARQRDAGRGNANQRGYNHRWRKAGKAYLDEHPLCECEECAQRLVPRPAEVVDHKVPHRRDQALFWDQDNWQAMAKVCHDRKTANNDGGFGR